MPLIFRIGTRYKQLLGTPSVSEMCWRSFNISVYNTTKSVPKWTNCHNGHMANMNSALYKILDKMAKKSTTQRIYGNYVHESSDFHELARPRLRPAPPSPLRDKCLGRKTNKRPHKIKHTPIQKHTNKMNKLVHNIIKLNQIIDVKKYLTLINNNRVPNLKKCTKNKSSAQKMKRNSAS